MSRQLPLQPLLQAERLPARGLHHVAEDRGQVPPPPGLAGHRLHQPRQRGVRLPAGEGLRRQQRGPGDRTTGYCPCLPLLIIQLYGQ